MSGRTTRYQGGSIVSFIIIAVIVTAALGVGLYALRQRSEQARIGSTASQDVPSELPGASSKDTQNATDTETFPSSTKDEANNSKDKEATAGSSNTEATTRPGESSSSSSVAALPETGPEQVLIIPVLAVVAYAVVAYAGSTRSLARLR